MPKLLREREGPTRMLEPPRGLGRLPPRGDLAERVKRPCLVRTPAIPARKPQRRRGILLGLRDLTDLEMRRSGPDEDERVSEEQLDRLHLARGLPEQGEGRVEVPGHRQRAAETRDDARPIERDAALAEGLRLHEHRKRPAAVASSQIDAR